MMKWSLIAWILQNDVWIQGDLLDGWGMIEQPSKAECLTKIKRAFDISGGDAPIRFTCKQLEVPNA